MYASIRRYPGDAALADRLAARADDVRSLISAVSGFRAYYLVRGADGTASVTICDDLAGVEESNRAAAAFLREHFPDAAVAPPEVTAGDVVISG